MTTLMKLINFYAYEVKIVKIIQVKTMNEIIIP